VIETQTSLRVVKGEPSSKDSTVVNRSVSKSKLNLPEPITNHSSNDSKINESMWIYYIVIAVNLLHVSVTFCGRLQGHVFTNDILQRRPNQCTNV